MNAIKTKFESLPVTEQKNLKVTTDNSYYSSSSGNLVNDINRIKLYTFAKRNNIIIDENMYINCLNILDDNQFISK